MKTYTIIGGADGVGKSSLMGSFKAQTCSLGTIVDDTAEAGAYPLAGDKIALKRIKSCLERGVCFTQESTLSGRFVAETAREAVERGYYVRLYYVGLDSAEECIQRIANRVSRGGHDIDSAMVQRRFSARWESLAALLPYCNEAIFFDNDNGFVEVAEYRNGELIVKGKRCPQWLNDLSAYLKENPPIC